MRVKVQKWGNSLALRIPKAFASQSKIREDEYVKLTLEDNKIVIEPNREKSYTLSELINGINETNLHGEVNTGQQTGSEHW
jgi:antitoxin MazE